MKISNHSFRHYFLLPTLFVFLSLVVSCNNATHTTAKTETKSDSLTEEQKHLPENALKGL